MRQTAREWAVRWVVTDACAILSAAEMARDLKLHRLPILRAQLFVVAVFVCGTIGYRLLEGASWWDSFFMTVITVTTVGYEQEIPLSRGGEIFTSFLLFAGLGALLFVATEISRWVVEGELISSWGVSGGLA